MSRTYPVPGRIASALLGDRATMDDIDMLIESGVGDDETRAWAHKVRDQHVTRRLTELLGEDPRLPVGLVIAADDCDVVVAMGRGDKVWLNGWQDLTVEFDDVISLTQEEVVFTADAITAGAAGLALRANMPLALGTRTNTVVAAAVAPPNAKIVAVVDDSDRNAVLDLLAILPGPVIYRRHDGAWKRDDAWLRALKSVRPPPVVQLDGEMFDNVAAQIDEATRGKEFKEAITSSAMPWEARLDDMMLEWAILAGGSMVASRMPANLQRYWLTGRGAAKIRWGTPGAWRRCFRQLSKYMNPHSAKGACTNLSEKLGGHGVATHVG